MCNYKPFRPVQKDLPMNNILRVKMEEARILLENKLFNAKTSLVYDSLSSHDPEHRFDHLPYPEEISLQLPNPAGWGTGMEDSMLNAGSVVEAYLIRAELESETRVSSLAFIRKIIQGMKLCATVHGKPGFVVRSVSPRDGKSCYINSSRDQFTLFAYGLWRFFRSPFAEEADQKLIMKLLSAVADYCEEHVCSATGNNLLRLDGQPAMVSRMVGVNPHEEFRLPMLYLAAYAVSGKERYFTLYKKYADKALDITLSLDTARSWWNLELAQMQISLALAFIEDPSPVRQEKIHRIMNLVADIAEQSFLEHEGPRMLGFEGDWDQETIPWAKAWKMTLRSESIHSDGPSLFYGLLYMKPWESKLFIDAFDRIRAVGNLAVAVALNPTHKPSEKFVSMFRRAAVHPTYTRHTSAGVCNMLHGYYLLRKRVRL